MKSVLFLAATITGILYMAGCNKFDSIFDENNNESLTPISFYDERGQSLDNSWDLIGALAERMGYSSQKDFAFVINDQALLQDVVLENGTILQWPVIDFEKYSLVAGYFYAPYPKVTIAHNQRIIVSISVITLYVQESSRKALQTSDTFGTTDAQPSQTYFCYLYPKLPNKPVRIVRLRK